MIEGEKVALLRAFVEECDRVIAGRHGAGAEYFTRLKELEPEERTAVIGSLNAFSLYILAEAAGSAFHAERQRIEGDVLVESQEMHTRSKLTKTLGFVGLSFLYPPPYAVSRDDPAVAGKMKEDPKVASASALWEELKNAQTRREEQDRRAVRMQKYDIASVQQAFPEPGHPLEDYLRRANENLKNPKDKN